LRSISLDAGINFTVISEAGKLEISALTISKLLNSAVDDIDKATLDCIFFFQQIHKGLFTVNRLGKVNELVSLLYTLLNKGYFGLIVNAKDLTNL